MPRGMNVQPSFALNVARMEPGGMRRIVSPCVPDYAALHLDYRRAWYRA